MRPLLESPAWKGGVLYFPLVLHSLVFPFTIPQNKDQFWKSRRGPLPVHLQADIEPTLWSQDQDRPGAVESLYSPSPS